MYIKNYSEFNSTDVIFYGYKSTTTPAIGSAELFYKHLRGLVNPKKKLGDISRNDTIVNYKQILFVGHSLGAVVIRRTLLDAKRDNCSWLQYCKIILFAPAHRGAHIHRLVIEGIPNSFKLIGSIAKYIFQSLNDLEESSSTIKDLISDNISYLDDPNNNAFTIAVDIVSAVNDRVVLKNRFCQDPNPLAIEDKGHISVCKPILTEYEEPFEIVKKNL